MQNNLSYYQCQRNITWNIPTVMTKIFDFLFFDILLGTQRHEDGVIEMLQHQDDVVHDRREISFFLF